MIPYTGIVSIDVSFRKYNTLNHSENEFRSGENFASLFRGLFPLNYLLVFPLRITGSTSMSVPSFSGMAVTLVTVLVVPVLCLDRKTASKRTVSAYLI